MNKISYIFDNDNTIDIELIENDFVESWLQFFVNDIENRDKISYISYNFSGAWGEYTKEQIDIDLILIEASLDFLSKKFFINFDNLLEKTKREKENSPQVSQRYLNEIHRTFTRMMNNQNVLGHLEIYDEITQRFIHNLNDAVHRLESRSAFKNSLRRKMFSDPMLQIIVPNSFPIEKEWIKFKFDPNIDLYDHTVWLNEDILGKDMIRAWLDEDLIHYDDITGNLFQTSSILLDPFKNIKKIIDLPEWKEYYSCTYKTLDRFPIGNIVSRNSWGARTPGGKIKKVLLNNKVIYG